MKKAFSLIELAIAITIISVLIALGLTSKSIVTQYELKQIMTQVMDYENAFKSFYEIYQKIPGDMSEGYSYFGDTYCTNNTISSSNLGCNGDGDDIVSGFGSNGDDYESVLAFYHLYKANLVSFNNKNNLNLGNTSCVTSVIQDPLVNVPALDIRDAGIYIENLYGVDGTIPYNLSLIIASGSDCVVTDPATNPLPDLDSILTANEVSELENKYDDNLPASGKIQVPTSETACINGSSYLITSNGNNCRPRYNFYLNRKMNQSKIDQD